MRHPSEMPTVSAADLARVLPITGYLDRVSARPGGMIEAKVSAQGGGRFAADVVRILCADPNPDGPGLIYEPQDFGLEPDYPARHQPIDLGSYAVVAESAVPVAPQLTFACLVQPWLLRDTPSVIAAAQDTAGRGWRVEITSDALRFVVTGDAEAAIEVPVTVAWRGWLHVWAGFDTQAGRVSVGWSPFGGDGGQSSEAPANMAGMASAAALSFAAALTDGVSSNHFNGRLEDPVLYHQYAGTTEPPLAPDAPPDTVRAWWDFADGISTQSILDRGPFGLAGRLVNVPYRGMRGARWSGRVMDWAKAPREYAAIHFHEDDLYDCGWETDVSLCVPDNARSGVYGLRLRYNGDQDILPFYVLPQRQGSTNRICFLASTLTHQAYANHARGNCDDGLRRRMAGWGASLHNPDDYPVYGRSTYNYHPDGSGIAFSSRLRPCLTIRPGYLTFDDPKGSGLRHFSADTHLLYWLEQKGLPIDVVTDEDLDDEGAGLLEGYATVIMGSHPEYHTHEMLDALTTYRNGGGKLIYLGGNGFYWKIARAPTLPGMIELRRAEGGIRAWAPEPGEAHHQTDGGYGGLWRRNGRPPQQLVGVGFSSQGLFDGSYYRRTDASYDADVAWIFDGVTEEKLGDYGLSGGGAAGFELDRADPMLGTPAGTKVLARSENHSDSFVAVPEELLSHIHTVTGEDPDDLIRAEIIYANLPNGGAIFSVGSICFCGSLLHNDGVNGVSRMVENVVRRFAGLEG